MEKKHNFNEVLNTHLFVGAYIIITISELEFSKTRYYYIQLWLNGGGLRG